MGTAREGHKTKLDRVNVIQGFFKLFEKCPAEASDVIIERVQHAMLGALESYCGAIDQSLDTRINRAKDLDELWYLRPTLMYAISAHKGEQIALSALSEITSLFGRSDFKTTPIRR